MSWADYGFPDITMMPCYLPAKALQLAFAERETILAGQDSGIAEDYTPTMFVQETGHHFTQGSDGMFGGHCWAIPGTYINHFLDLDEPVGLVGIGRPTLFWREVQEIKPIIEAVDTTGLGYLDPHMFFSKNPLTMMPEWSKVWLEQRYLAMNLLKILEVPFVVTVRRGSTGSTWNPALTTPQLAFDYAMANSVVYEGSSATSSSALLSMYTTIRESPSWIGGLYYCDFIHLERVDIDYSRVPHLAGLPAYIYVGTSAGTAWDPGYIFDNHGFPIRDGHGIITKIPLPWESDGIAYPVGGLVVGATVGYTVRMDRGVSTNYYWQHAGVDVSSAFQFYDNVDDTVAAALAEE